MFSGRGFDVTADLRRFPISRRSQSGGDELLCERCDPTRPACVERLRPSRTEQVLRDRARGICERAVHDDAGQNRASQEVRGVESTPCGSVRARVQVGDRGTASQEEPWIVDVCCSRETARACGDERFGNDGRSQQKPRRNFGSLRSERGSFFASSLGEANCQFQFVRREQVSRRSVRTRCPRHVGRRRMIFIDKSRSRSAPRLSPVVLDRVTALRTTERRGMRRLSGGRIAS